MGRTLPCPPGLPWRSLSLVALWTINAILLAITLAAFLYADVGVDWDIYTEAGRRFTEGNLYTWDGLPYRYSPLMAPVFAALAPIGYLGWSALHFAALLTIPRRLALLALVSAPFWNDVYNGNTMIFVFVAAVWALRGKPWAFFVLAVLIPRPVMLPVLGWVLWHRREYVGPFLAVGAFSLLGAYTTGWLGPWITGDLTNLSDTIIADIGPGMIIGAWWYPVGWALAAWFTYRGQLGVASFLATGYWSLHYGIMLLLPLGGDDAPSTTEVNEEGGSPLADSVSRGVRSAESVGGRAGRAFVG